MLAGRQGVAVQVSFAALPCELRFFLRCVIWNWDSEGQLLLLATTAIRMRIAERSRGFPARFLADTDRAFLRVDFPSLGNVRLLLLDAFQDARDAGDV